MMSVKSRVNTHVERFVPQSSGALVVLTVLACLVNSMVSGIIIQERQVSTLTTVPDNGL